MPEPIEFFFDYASPYGYFAGLRIDALAAAHGRTVAWKPILLGAVFKVTGSRPNMDIPLRGDYLAHDVRRIARRLGVPFAWPSVIPVNGLAGSRAVWWATARDPMLGRRLAAALYHAYWGEGRDIGPVGTVVEIAAGLGIPAEAVGAALQDPAVKDRLRAEVDGAIARGVCGSPFVIVDGEPFWGWDRLDMVDAWLAEGGW